MICLQKTEKDWMNFLKNKLCSAQTDKKTIKKMEALIVHPKNQMELNALKSVMKDMGIRYEKFHTRGMKTQPAERKAPVKKDKPATNYKDKPKTKL